MSTHPIRRPASWAVGLLALSILWLGLRVALPGDGISPWLFWPFLAIEMFGLMRVVALGLRLHSGRRAAADAQAMSLAASEHASTDVAVLVTDEDPDRLRLSVLGATRVEGAARVLLVGPDTATTRELAEEFGAERLIHGSTGDAPGAMRLAMVAIGATTADRLAFVTSDSVVHHDVVALSESSFRDVRVAWVQSMARSAPERDVLHRLENDQIAPADSASGVAEWNVNASVVSVASFREVLAEIDVEGVGSPERFRVDLLAAGWRGAWSPVSLAIANGPELRRHDADVAAGAGRVRLLFSSHSPLWARRMPRHARLTAVCTLLDGMRGLVALSFLAVVTASLLSGRLPFSLELWGMLIGGLAVHAGTSFVRWHLTEGRVGPLATARTSFESIDNSIAMIATAIAGRVVGADRSRAHVAFVATMVLQVALALRALSEVTGWPLASPDRIEAMVALTAGVAATVPLLRAIDVIIPMTLRRNSARSQGNVQIDLAGLPVQVLDLSPLGVGVRTTSAETGALAVGALASVLVRAPGRNTPLRVQGVVRSSVLLADDSHRLGIEFIDTSRSTRDALMGLWAAAWIPSAADARNEVVAPRTVDALKVQVNRRSNPAMRVLAAITLIATGVASLPPYGVAAASAPPLPENTLAITKEVRGVGPTGVETQGTTLYGAATSVKLTAFNTWSADDEARERYFNVSFRDVVPAGVTYVPGSATIAPTAIVNDEPEKGETTLIWQNVSDAQPGSSTSLSYRVTHNDSGKDDQQLYVGDTIGGAAEAYANTHPRYVPNFEPDGVVVEGGKSYSAKAEAKGTTTIVPIQIYKSEPSPEHELMRGAHRPTTYTLTVANNLIVPTAKVVVDDYLPAGLEFLGCGTADHTPDDKGTEGGVEYPGAPRLNESSPQLTESDGCANPVLVETIEGDPDQEGPLAKGIYTHVQWPLGDMGVGETRTITYLAAIPERANTMWPTIEAAPEEGAEPVEGAEDLPPVEDGSAPRSSVPTECAADKPDSCEQVANLGNNNGPLTTETEIEQALTNGATVGGYYQGRVHDTVNPDQVWDRTTETVTAEDLAIQKWACNSAENGVDGGRCPNGVQYGDTTDWTLRIRTGEYRDASDIVVTDHLPDGLEYVGGSAVVQNWGQLEPDVAGGENGTQDLTWKLPDSLKTDTDLTLTFQSVTLENYRATKLPVLAFDTLSNRVDITGTTSVVRGDDDLDRQKVADESGDQLSSQWYSVAKSTLSGDAAAKQSIGREQCAIGSSNPVSVATDGPRFSPGDLVCFELTVDMPQKLRLRDVLLTDFLPDNAEYVGFQSYEDDTLGQYAEPEVVPEYNNAVIWTYGAPINEQPRYTPVDGGRFHVVVGARVANDPQANNDFDLYQNLLKVTAVDTAGASPVSPRALSPYLVAEPVLGLTKGVVDVQRGDKSLEGNPIDAPVLGNDGHPVAQRDLVTYRIDIANTGVQFRDPGKDPDDPSDDVAATRGDCLPGENFQSELSQANQADQQILQLFRGNEPQQQLGQQQLAQANQDPNADPNAAPSTPEEDDAAKKAAEQEAEAKEAELKAAEEQAAKDKQALEEAEANGTDRQQEVAEQRMLRSSERKRRLTQERLSTGMRINSSNGCATSQIRDADFAEETAQQRLSLLRGDETLEQANQLKSANEDPYANLTDDERKKLDEQQTADEAAAKKAAEAAASMTDEERQKADAEAAQQVADQEAKAAELQAEADKLQAEADAKVAELQRAADADGSGDLSAEEQEKLDAELNAQGLSTQKRLATGYRINSRLNSGSRINSAKDDAAGLEIEQSSLVQTSDAFKVEVWDVLPAQVGCDAFALTDEGKIDGGAELVLRPGALPLAVAPEASVVDANCDAESHRVTMTVDHIPAGYDLRLTYRVLVPSTVAAGTTHTDTAGVRSYYDLSGSVPYYPEDNIDSDVAPDGKYLPNSPAAKDDATLTLAAATIAKARTTAVTESNNNTDDQATIGERVQYTVAVTVPYGTSVYGAHVEDTLPATLTLTPGTAVLTAPDGLDTNEFKLSETGDNGWTLDLPASYRNESEGDQIFLVTYDAVVTDVSAAVAAATIINTVDLGWNYSPDAPEGSSEFDQTSSASTTTTVVEPKPTITKAHTPTTAAVGGSIVTYTVKPSNTAGRSPLHDVLVTDCVPAGLNTVTPTGTYAANATVELGGTGCATNATRIVWDLSTVLENPTTRPTTLGLQAGEAPSLTYTATVITPAAADASLVNTAVVTGSSLSGAVDGERTTYPASVVDTLKTAKPTIVKSVDQATRLPGESAVYSLTVTLPKGLVAYDYAVIDTLPANMKFDSYAALPTLGAGCSLSGTASHTVPRSGQKIGWFIGDLTATTGPCTFVLSYTAHVGSAAVAGDSLKNTASQLWNLTDRQTDVAAVSGLTKAAFDKNSDTNVTVKAIEPKLTITKAVNDTDRIVEAGQPLTYTLTIANTANAANGHAAYDIDLSDVYPSGLGTPTNLGGTCVGAADGAVNATTRKLTWTLFTGTVGLAKDATCTVTYTQIVDAANAGTLSDGGTLKNTATIGDYWGDATHSTDGFKKYTGGSVDQTVTTYLPNLLIAKFTGSGQEVADADIGSPFGWTLIVSNTGRGTAYGVDVSDTLPINWTFDSGSVQFAAADGTVCSPDASLLTPPVVTTPGADGDVQTITWTDLCDLPAHSELTITYTATPQFAAAITPGLIDPDGEKVLQPNTATADGTDAGGTPLAQSTDDAAATLRSADLRIIKTDASPDDEGGPDSAGFTVGVDGVYYLDVRNVGPDAASGPVVVTDTLPAGLTPTSAVGAIDGEWECDIFFDTVTCTASAGLAANASLSRIVVTADVGLAALNDADSDSDSDTGLVTNTASVISPTPDPVAENNSDDEPTPVVRRADLGIVKTLDAATPFVPGTDVNYGIVVTNVGPSPASGPITVTDELPDRLRLVSAGGTGWDCSSTILPTSVPAPGTASAPGVGYSGTGPSDGGVSDDNGSVSCVRTANDDAAGTVYEPIIVTASIDPATPASTTVTNVATVESDHDDNPANDSSDASDDSDPSATLTIAKDDGDAVFTAGQTDGLYYLTVANTGPSVEAGPVVVTDDIDEYLQLDSVQAPGWDCTVTAGTGFGDGERGSLSCTWIGIDAPSGSAPAAVGVDETLGLITVVVKVDPAAVVDPRPGAENLVGNTASVTGGTDTTTRTDDEDTPVLPSSALTIDKLHIAGTEPWEVGSDQDFQFVVGNDGPSGEYGEITVEDTLPVGIAFVDFEGNGWDCELRTGAGRGPNGTVHCEYGRDGLDDTDVLLAPGDTLPTLSIGVEVLPSAAPNPQPVPGPLTNEVSNTASVVGITDAVDHTDTDVVPIQPMADLQVTKTHAAESFQVGQTGEFTIEVLNNGPNLASGPIEVVDTLPAGLEFVSAEGLGWTCAPNDGDTTVTCVHPDAIAVDETSTITMTVTVLPTAYTPESAGDADPIDDPDLPELDDHQVRNLAVVSGQTPDIVPDNDRDDDVVDIDPLVDLTITKTHEGDFRVTEQGEFTLVVSNLGPNKVPVGPITVLDTLPAGLPFESVTGEDWECVTDPAQTVITCTYEGPLGVDEELPPITVTVDVTTAAEGGVVNSATVATPVAEVSTDNNSASDRVNVTPLSNLSITKSLQGQLTMGRQGVWRVVIHNDGPSAAANPVVSDRMPAQFTDIAASGDGFSCSVSGTEVTCARTSPLAADASAELIVTGTIASGGGDTVTNSATVSTSTPESNDDDNSASASGVITQVASNNAGGGDTQVGGTEDSRNGSDGSGGTGVLGTNTNQSLANRLAYTGLSVLGVLAAGVAFLVGGFILTGFGRRRRSHS